MSQDTLALLIDGDNASPKIINGLLAEIANYGTASVRRIYGDWTKPSLNGRHACWSTPSSRSILLDLSQTVIISGTETKGSAQTGHSRMAKQWAYSATT